MSYWKYLWTNAKYFVYWLPLPGLFITYWALTQSDWIGDAVFTCIIVGAIQALIMIGLYVKWKRL